MTTLVSSDLQKLLEDDEATSNLYDQLINHSCSSDFKISTQTLGEFNVHLNSDHTSNAKKSSVKKKC